VAELLLETAEQCRMIYVRGFMRDSSIRCQGQRTCV
jgi:hypothetical protein